MPITIGAAPATGVAGDDGDGFAAVYPISVPLIAAGGTQQLSQGPARFSGWSMIEPSGAAPAVVELYDGMDTGAQLLAVINLPAGGAAPTGVSHDGVEVREGMLLSVVTGSVRGVVWARLLVAR
jgi:hypothetical protein